MRILLDESLPRPLAGHDVRTVSQMGWTGLSNGELLRAAGASFDAVLTADQGMEFQQNWKELPVALVVLAAPTNRIESIEQLLPELITALGGLRPRQFVRLEAKRLRGPEA